LVVVLNTEKQRNILWKTNFQQCSSHELQVKKGECSLLLKFGKGISFLKAQESSFNIKYCCKRPFTYPLKFNQLQMNFGRSAR